MKPSEPESIKDITNFLTIYKLAGLAPFSLKPTERLLLIIYQILHLVLLIYIFIAAFFIYDAFQENSLSSLVSGLVFCTLSLAHIVVNLQALFTRNKQQKVCDMYVLIDREFREKLTVQINTKQWCRKYVISFLVVIFIVLANDTAISVSKILNGVFGEFWFTFYSRQIIRLRLLQCMHYVQMASERLKLLNGKIEEIVAARSPAPNFAILEADYGKYQLANGSKSNSFSNNKILMLKQIFGHVWEATNIINDCFGWSLLAIITYYFLDFTSNGYWLFLALEDILPRYVIMECLCSIVPLAFMLSILSWVCNNCKQLSETTGCLVHKLEKSIENDQYNSLVSEFSLQVMHEPIYISANGFFTIDFELLGSMAAATVTYLVILIQFLLNEKSHRSASQNVTQTQATPT